MDQIWKASLKFYLFKIIFLSIIWDPGLSHVPGCFSICNPGDSSSVLETAMKTATDLWTCFSFFFSFLGYLSAVQVTKIFSCPLTYFNFPPFFFSPTNFQSVVAPLPWKDFEICLAFRLTWHDRFVCINSKQIGYICNIWILPYSCAWFGVFCGFPTYIS